MSREEAISSKRQSLIDRRDALRRALAGDLSLLKEPLTQAAGDEVIDLSQGATCRDITSRMVEVRGRELESIERALERMDEGEYGVCEGCGGKIPAARLQALDYATNCVKCQREADLQGATS